MMVFYANEHKLIEIQTIMVVLSYEDLPKRSWYRSE